MIDNNLAQNGPGGGGKSGYTFAITVTAPAAAAPSTFYTTAVPISSTSGTKSFCAADDGVVRNGAAGTTVVPAATRLAWLDSDEQLTWLELASTQSGYQARGSGCKSAALNFFSSAS